MLKDASEETEARNIRRRAIRRKKTLSPYWNAARRAAPSSVVSDYLELREYNPRRKMAVFGVDDWVKYSNQETWHVELTILVIYDRDSNQYNSIRVSPRCRDIQDALYFLKPVEVQKAEKEKKKVVRQGDMYFIPQRIWNLSELRSSNHRPWFTSGRNGALYPWAGEKPNGNRVVIVHPHHKPLTPNQPHKVRQQITVFGRAHAMAD